MAPHRIIHKSFTMPNNSKIDLKYWADGDRMCVAAFDSTGKQVSVCSYCFEVEDAEAFHAQFDETVMERLSSMIEYDLQNNPDIHYQK